MNNLFVNELNGWKTEVIPAEIIENAESRVLWENNPENGYKRGIETILLSVQVISIKTELRPNPVNIDTADTVRVRNWSYTTKVIDKRFKNGNVKSHNEENFCFSELIEVLEIGGYKNPNN